ncbi:sulfotransferase [Gloeocapsopsis sp. IPPAS B-1203]|uniref:sulfotransferase family protein n=1 Tax=Gloeocapsopsis sp. IPPAS B-1203 TaxID=2049454 RepID=UPI000C19C518|nr:sulfotransferase [Gloeocapsopsis sp. IPPAS B-1203]PIG95298.1 sulfotransferase family protein [Gloeocapsopsis sp. IPPAS B-1203]
MTTNKANVASKKSIFIVGASRSGTTLIQQILNKHSGVHITPRETHYFDDLRVKMAGREQQALSLAEIKLTEDYFLALTHKRYGEGIPEQGWMDRIELRMLAQKLGYGTDSYFEAFCQLSAQRDNKTQWGEKTPRHIFKLSEILTRYPSAKVICMVRHPGGVIASYRDWRNVAASSQKSRITNSYNPTIISLMWKAAFNAALQAREQFGTERVYIQRFEDLITAPESTLSTLTSWLGLDYEPSMLEINLVNSSYSDKPSSSRVGFSKEPAYRWREKLEPTEIATFQYICGGLLNKVGYEQEPISVPPVLIIGSWITLPFAGLRSLIANKSRISNIFNYVWRRFCLAFSQ